MLGGLQDFLIEKGWERYERDFSKGRPVDIENHTSNYLSSYGPIGFYFKHKDYPDYEIYYGLAEHGKPPVMTFWNLDIVMINDKNYRTPEDAFRIISSEVTPDVLYDTFLQQKEKYFVIHFNDEEKVSSIEIKNKTIS